MSYPSLPEIIESVLTQLNIEKYSVTIEEKFAEIRHTPEDELELNPELQWCAARIIMHNEQCVDYSISFNDIEAFPEFVHNEGPFAYFGEQHKVIFKELPWFSRYPIARLTRVKSMDNFDRVLAKIFTSPWVAKPADVCTASAIAMLRGYSRDKIKELEQRIKKNTEASWILAA